MQVLEGSVNYHGSVTPDGSVNAGGPRADDSSLGTTLVEIPWFQDDITEHERWALRYIKDVHQEDASLGVTLAALAWFQDNITEHERWALRYIKDVYQKDPSLARIHRRRASG